jgi:hypothetical protein
MPYALPTPSTLNDIYQMNPGAFGQAQQFMGGGVQQNDADLQASQLKNMFDQQNDPLRLQHQGLINQQLDAQIPGMSADSSMKVRKNSNEGILNQDVLDQAKRDFISKATDAHLKELYDKGQEMAYSLDPRIRAQGEAILAMHPDIVKDRMKQQEETKRQLATTSLQGKTAKEIAQMNIDAGKFAKGSKVTLTLDQAIDNAKSAKERYQKLVDAAMQAKQSGNDDAYDNYMVRAEAVRPQAEAEIQNLTPKAGTPDLGALGVTANPSVSIAPKADTKSLLSKLPTGSKDNGDGTFTLPSGKVVRPKQ